MEGFSTSEKYLGKYEIDKDGFVKLGDIARGEIGRQAQYVSRLIDGLLEEYPNLGEGLRFSNVYRNEKATGDYHNYKIHKDSIEEFVKRAKEYYQDSK